MSVNFGRARRCRRDPSRPSFGKRKPSEIRRSLFLKNILAYSGASVFAQFAQVVQNLLVRRFLAPPLMGMWNRVGVIQSFVGTFDLGVTQAAGRELPLLRGAGQFKEEQIVRSTACWARLGQGVLFATGIVIVALLWKGQHDMAQLRLAGIAAVLVAVLSWNDTFTVFCQSAQCYVALGRSMAASALVSVVLLPIAAWLGGLPGMMGAAVVAAVIQAILLTWMARTAGIWTTLSWRWPIIRRLVFFGLPLRLVDYPLSLFMILDSLVVAHYCSAAQLAIYATAQLLFAVASDLPSRMGNVLLSRMYFLIGGNTDRLQVGEELRRFLFVQHTLLMPLLLTTLWWGAQFILRTFLLKYASALDVAQVLLVGIYFIPASTLIRNFWIIDKRLISLFASNLGGLAAGTGALLIAARAGHFQLNWISGGMVCGYAIHFAILLFSIGRSVWGARIAMVVGLGAFSASIYVACLLRYIPGPGTGVAGIGALAAFALQGWAKTQLVLAPLYAVGIWRGSVLQLISRLFPKQEASIAT